MTEHREPVRSGVPEEILRSEAYQRGVRRAEEALALGSEDAAQAATQRAEWAEAQLGERLEWDKPS